MGCGGSKAPAVLLKAPPKPKYRVAIVGFNSPSEDPSRSDKDRFGVRYDSTPIANGMINAGAACDLLTYSLEGHDAFVAKAMAYDGLVVRINPGQLAMLDEDGGAQKRFDDAMDAIAIKGKAIWSNPIVQKRMGAKDALVKIKDLKCGLPDTFSYYDRKSFEEGFKKSCAFSPRVIKQNRGTAGEGIWLVWLESKRYCETFGDKSLTDRDRLKLMEMSDNHVEYHTVKEFIEFCVNGPGGEASNLWASTFPGRYLDGGRAGGGQIVDQRLLPRIVEGEVRMLMVKDQLFQIIHKKPKDGEMTAIGSHADFTYFSPDAPRFRDLREQFESEIPDIMAALDIAGEPMPILWTADFIPVDNHISPYVVGEFNCACVSIGKFAAAAGKDLTAVKPADMAEGYRLTNLMGRKAVEKLDSIKHGGGFTAVGKKAPKPAVKGAPAPKAKNDLHAESTPLPGR